MKLSKKLITLALASTMCFSSITIFANETRSIYENEVSNRTEGKFVNEYRYRKKNVSTSETWSEYKRVSDNLKTGPEGGSISANKSVTFNTSISGKIDGLNISTGISKSSSKGYTLSVGGNKTVYMGYRVKYSVETGTREMYDMISGKVISSNTYTVKTPLYGEYALLNY